jgi:hypothetical protein
VLLPNAQVHTVAPGAGQMNYELFMQRLGEINSDAPIIMEAVAESDMLRARGYLEELRSRFGQRGCGVEATGRDGVSASSLFYFVRIGISSSRKFGVNGKRTRTNAIMM